MVCVTVIKRTYANTIEFYTSVISCHSPSSRSHCKALNFNCAEFLLLELFFANFMSSRSTRHMKISGFSVERLSLVGSFHSALSVQVLRIMGVNAAGVTRGSEGGEGKNESRGPPQYLKVVH